MTTSYAKAKAKYQSKSKPPADDDDEPITHRCFAEGCPMAPGIAAGGRNWVCAYHHGALADDLPRVTSVLNQHKDLRDVICDARRLTNRSMSTSALDAEVSKLRDLLLFAGYSIPKCASVTAWIYACEQLLASFTSEIQKASAPPPVQTEFRP